MPVGTPDYSYVWGRGEKKKTVPTGMPAGDFCFPKKTGVPMDVPPAGQKSQVGPLFNIHWAYYHSSRTFIQYTQGLLL